MPETQPSSAETQWPKIAECRKRQEGHKFTPVITIWDLCNTAHLAVRVQEDLIHQPHFLIDHVQAVQTFCDKGGLCQGCDRRPYPHWM